MRELLTAVIKIAEDAGQAILAIYEKDFSIEEKSDQSPLTAADMASHHLIVDRLAAISPLPVLSEESTEIDWALRQSWNSYWLIDPLDGTKEFIKRNGEFTVNIALIEDGRAVLGVVYAPVLKRMYFASKGMGAFRQDDAAQPYSIRALAARPENAWRVVGSRSHHSDKMAAFLAHLKDATLVSMGSSLKLCLVADGSADLYPRLIPTSEWDTAAAQCVVEEAGGEVLTEQLVPLDYNSKESLLNPDFIVCGARMPEWTTFFAASAVNN